ncbi:MAG: hypothetical protein MGG11_01700 [Trichodesmium sp. MAG_R03]|nr:hypothetical protein [Trichodesmium sp. MAG_R03]
MGAEAYLYQELNAEVRVIATDKFLVPHLGCTAKSHSPELILCIAFYTTCFNLGRSSLP